MWIHIHGSREPIPPFVFRFIPTELCFVLQVLSCTLELNLDRSALAKAFHNHLLLLRFWETTAVAVPIYRVFDVQHKHRVRLSVAHRSLCHRNAIVNNQSLPMPFSSFLFLWLLSRYFSRIHSLPWCLLLLYMYVLASTVSCLCASVASFVLKNTEKPCIQNLFLNSL